MTSEKQGAAEWLRGIINGSCEKKAYPTCCEIAETFFGIECMKTRSCGSCILMMLTAIADRIDAERELPEGIEWPRFEDGELVNIGDEVELDGEAAKVLDVVFSAERFSLFADTATTSGRIYGDFGERVKRPTPKVLDADGAPIEVGDTVYCDGEDEALTVTSISGVGVEYCCVTVKNADSSHCTVDAPRLTHERPDSWERIEEDAKLAPRDYLEKRGMNPEKTERIASMMADLVRRAKALAKAGEVE